MVLVTISIASGSALMLSSSVTPFSTRLRMKPNQQPV